MEAIIKKISGVVAGLLSIGKSIEKLAEVREKDTHVHISVDEEYRGKPGKTPERGVDFWTEADKKELVGLVKQEIKTADEKKIIDKAEDFVARDVDFAARKLEKKVDRTMLKAFKEQDKKSKSVLNTLNYVIKEVRKLAEAPKVKAFDLAAALLDIATAKLIARSLERLKGNDRLSAKAVKGIPLPGGGSITTVLTGSGTSVNIDTQKLTATQVGNDITLDLTGLSHAYTSILLVTREGNVLTKDGSNVVNKWSKAGDIITVPNADASEDFLVQYTY